MPFKDFNCQFEPDKNKFIKRKLFLIFLGLSVIIHSIVTFYISHTLKDLTSDKATPQITKINLKENKQVVQITASEQQVRPKEADFYAEFDQQTKKQTKSKISSLNPAAIANKSLLKKEALDFKNKSINKKHVDSKNPHKIKAVTKEDPLGIRPFLNASAADDAMPFADHLENIEESDKTSLNTWQWQHAPFFNRIKNRIAQIWSPQSQINRFDPQGLMLGIKDRITVVSVSIDKAGKLTDLIIVDQSGVKYLDDEAVRTFKKAAPFVNPPKELFADGDFKFKFAFHIQVNRGFNFDFKWDSD